MHSIVYGNLRIEILTDVGSRLERISLQRVMPRLRGRQPTGRPVARSRCCWAARRSWVGCGLPSRRAGRSSWSPPAGSARPACSASSPPSTAARTWRGRGSTCGSGRSSWTTHCIACSMPATQPAALQAQDRAAGPAARRGQLGDPAGRSRPGRRRGRRASRQPGRRQRDRCLHPAGARTAGNVDDLAGLTDTAAAGTWSSATSAARSPPPRSQPSVRWPRPSMGSRCACTRRRR